MPTDLQPRRTANTAPSDMQALERGLLPFFQNYLAIMFIAFLLLSVIGTSPVALFGEPSFADATNGDGGASRQVLSILLVLAIGFYRVGLRGWRSLFDLPSGLIIVLGWCWLSLAWAVDPAIAFRRLVLTTIVVVSACYCVDGLGPRRAFHLMLTLFGLIVVADWLAIPMFRYAVHQAGDLEGDLGGLWRGLHNHKNEAGAFCVLTAIFYFFETIRTRSFIVGPAAFLLSVGFLFNTGSKTSIALLAVSILLGFLTNVMYGSRRMRRLVFGTVAFLVPVFCWELYQNTDLMISYLDDPGALTGRSQIWLALLNYAADHPLLGAGFGSFWSVGDSSQMYGYGTGWLVSFVTQAHNGYLDILVQLGVIGLIVSVFWLVLYPLYIVFCLPFEGDEHRPMFGAALLFVYLHEFLETTLLNKSHVIWVITLIIYRVITTKPAREDVPAATTAAPIEIAGPRRAVLSKP